jgi:hypothetical protein
VLAFDYYLSGYSKTGVRAYNNNFSAIQHIHGSSFYPRLPVPCDAEEIHLSELMYLIQSAYRAYNQDPFLHRWMVTHSHCGIPPHLLL